MDPSSPGAPDAEPRRGPLHGVKVVDLTSVVLAPFATQVLGDLGADVIKVEVPEGDVMRAPGPMRSPGMGHVYLNANRNKRSIVLDLKRAPAREALLRLLEDTDVFAYNVRPAAMARLRLAYDDVRAVNPRIIYAGAYGFGQNGPYAARPAFDDLIQAMSGSASLLGRSLAGADPQSGAPRYVPINFCDRVTGLHLLYAILAALYARERTGVGQAVEVPMFETMVGFVLGEHLGGRSFEPPLGPMGYTRILASHRRPYRTRDGYLSVLAYNDKQWRAFFDAIGRPELADDERFASQTGRARHIEAVYAFMAETLAQRDTDEWLRLLTAADIPHSPAMSLDDLISDPHLAAVGFFEEYDHPSEGRLRRTGIPTRFSATPGSIRRHPPTIGEHTDEVLREAGFSAAQIAAIRGDA